MQNSQSTSGGSARERLINAAYDLFAAHGIAQVGIDRILGESGCAKASLYNHFKSKTDLALAFLERREQRWTREWLEARVRKGSDGPEAQLLSVFDVFDAWFRQDEFEGCSFINVLLESEKDSEIHNSATEHLAKIRSIIVELAEAARLTMPVQFAHAWHMLMKGSIIAAEEGNRDAAEDAQRAARLVLEHWPREMSLHNT
ncbi:MAG: TetR/AcrR family transcriptional regulator [Pseudomonadales bacterium]|nr:TetR/AcrR family transcriptional regulator [Pseudomonadales bacterium]